MAKDDISPIQRASADARIHRAQKAHAREELMNMAARQVESEDDFKTISDQALFTPHRMQKDFKRLNEQIKRPPAGEQPKKSEEAKSETFSESTAAEQVAEDYFQRNPELQKKTLMALRQYVKDNDDADAILRKVQEFYTDKSLADEAIDFLIEAARTREESETRLIQAKERFNAAYGRDIRAGRNIAEQARAFSEKGLGNPTGLRDLYRNIVAAPRTPHELFEELSQKFKFSDMKNIIDFILHSLGADMKAKGPSISRAELQRLFGESRTMQAILGVFRFFFARMSLIKGQFDRYDLTLPSRINFELLARLFMKILEERYPSPNSIVQLSYVLGVSEEVAAQIIIFTQYRDAMRHVSPKLFKSERHRQDLLFTMIETLSDLEDEMEENQEEET